MAELLQAVVVGNSHRFSATGPDGVTGVLKDGVIWDLSGAVVTFYLRRPNRTAFHRAGQGFADGTARYDSPAGEIDVPGDWQRQWQFVDGGVEQVSEPIAFPVFEHL